MILRRGRKVGRTLYRQRGDQPADGDTLIGVMDTRHLAALVVHAFNAAFAPKPHAYVPIPAHWNWCINPDIGVPCAVEVPDPFLFVDGTDHCRRAEGDPIHTL